MSEPDLTGRRILVVEDEYVIADAFRAELELRGAVVVGPAPDIRQGMAMMQAEPMLDAALLDINLQGEMAFDLADALIERGVPLLIASGYDARVIPDRFSEVCRYEKPVAVSELVQTLGTLIGRDPAKL
ncbi:response regulator [Wenxinia saemankumensis]|uniref:Response regulator receiver domain-containing protein n=1 Tax=Wenxinia saemankumensis TaxID=1447782 RepID=A0A1M6HU27_9RHOB|nr:response regulator [Wenxinia saemankumensis]SHJ25637.1 Response regulator receiver domain-containing protein [Wenxinia saemankumensis]